MNLRTLIVVAALAAAGGGSALAQSATPGPTPEAKAARASAKQACAADAKTLCPGKVKMDLMMCMRANMSKASPGCQAAAGGMHKHQPKPASQ